jgi:two-component system, cell cycle sensor histidine kinase and response regulator CckA
MTAPLHILHLEDDPNDAALVQSTLDAAGLPCSIVPVQNRDDFVERMENGGIDLILSDCFMPGFDGLSALTIARERWPDTPFIFVSGTMGEERAIDSLKSGATDYVLKDRPARLVPAIHRAMQEVRDRCDRERLEAQFIEAQKMEVIGQLASGVAHDFNNILAVIMGYSDLMIQKFSENEETKSHLETIRSAAERATGLTRQLLVFSRRQTVQLVVLDMNDVLKDMNKMLRRLIDENIEMTVVPGKHIGRIKADSGYIGQLLMNLAVNARDAMPNGGNLTIATDNATLDESYARTHKGAISGDYVMLSVSDTGSGMTEEVKAHIFEAFFTTKPKGKGTGLGLATCSTIVEQSGGHISVDSTLGKGTTFRVYFPRVEQPIDISTCAAQNGPLPRGTETLLLVEDEPSVRHLACSVLEAHGYHVLLGSNGQEGLRVAREVNGQPIGLVITDVIMPQMGGKVMADWLHTANPNLKILFTSGYTDDAITQQGVRETGGEFLPKPYSTATLVRKVREMLDRK